MAMEHVVIELLLPLFLVERGLVVGFLRELQVLIDPVIWMDGFRGWALFFSP